MGDGEWWMENVKSTPFARRNARRSSSSSSSSSSSKGLMAESHPQIFGSRDVKEKKPRNKQPRINTDQHGQAG
jgi:hypothetical protein